MGKQWDEEEDDVPNIGIDHVTARPRNWPGISESDSSESGHSGDTGREDDSRDQRDSRRRPSDSDTEESSGVR